MVAPVIIPPPPLWNSSDLELRSLLPLPLSVFFWNRGPPHERPRLQTGVFGGDTIGAGGEGRGAQNAQRTPDPYTYVYIYIHIHIHVIGLPESRRR